MLVDICGHENITDDTTSALYTMDGVTFDYIVEVG